MSLLKKLKEKSSNINILYVEDNKELLESLSRYLSQLFSTVETAENGLQGLEKYKSGKFDIVITDIQMPHMDGIEMMECIREINPNQEILVTSAFSHTDYLLHAIDLDITGYIIKPINFNKMNKTLNKVVDRIKILNENIKYKTELEKMVEKRSKENLALQREKIDNYEKTLLSLVELVEKRDAYTGGHSQRVANYSKLIANHMGFSQNECNLVYKAGILHDIGKIETPDAVLLNPGKLDDLQYSIIKQHVVTGAKLLEKIPMYKELSKIIAQHHERYDGKGYPSGLKADEISPLAQIMIVADAFDAMTTNRIYKPRIGLKEALEELRELSAKQFHPKVVVHAIDVFKDLKLDHTIAQLPSSDMDKKKFAFFFEDQLTGLYNKAYLEIILMQNSNNKKAKFINILLFHNFEDYKNKYGWKKENILLKNIADILQKNYKECYIFRINWDDFVILSDNNIDIDTAIFDELLIESDDIIQIEKRKFSSKDKNIIDLIR